MRGEPSQLRATSLGSRVAIASDLHLSPDAPETAALWHHSLAHSQADAIVLLGDYFDVWVGDDVLEAQPPALAPRDASAQQQLTFWQDCAAHLRAASRQRPIYWMRGNRDFLIGNAFAQATGVTLLADPCVLEWPNARWLLSHGDAWCHDDHDYMIFRRQVRSLGWQTDFLSRPLANRLELARNMRQASQARQRYLSTFIDVNGEAVIRACQEANAQGVIHGHTHQGQDHDCPGHAGLVRHVTLDWDACARPARAQWLELSAQGIKRINLSPTAAPAP